MGNSSSKSVHHRNIIDNDGDNILSEAFLARRAEDIRRYRFPIESSADDVIPAPFKYTAFISPDSPPLLPTLPPELIENLVSHLDNHSIKNLRLTCKHLSTIKLRISRVFLSANPLNIHVLRSIADHDVYRQGITELIYDDARLCHSHAEHSENALPEDVSRTFYNRPMTNMEWFQVERNLNIDNLEERRATLDEPNRPKDLRIYRLVNAELSLGESWIYYQDLLRQQDDVIAHGADTEAFRYALQQFPALQRVTVTPAAHGWLFTPLYETPMIRAFPYGFNYPIPRGWPTTRFEDNNVEPAPWEDSKTRWRGYCLLTKVLAQERHHHVSELRIDSHHLQSGLNYRLFEQPSQEYLDFICCLQHPDLKRLHLSLYVDFHWAPFRRNLLRNALAKNSQLEHFSLETGMDISSYEPDDDPNQEWPPALQTLLPVDCWTNLQYFRLWNFPVDPADLISTLSQLPVLQLLELGFLSIRSGTQRQLLEDMRGSLRLHERLAQPKVRFAVPIPSSFVQGRAIWIDEEVEKFLYHGGENPFEDRHFDQVCYDMGVIKDAYDPGCERPYIHPRKHLELLRSNGYN